MSAGYDVIVIGLGGMGSAAAQRIAERGRRVLGIDQYGPAHDHGSSHGGSRIIRQAYLEGLTYVPLALRAYELWEQVQDRTGMDLLTITGGLVIGSPEGQPVGGTLAGAEAFGLDCELLTASQTRRRFPTLRPTDDLVAVYEPMMGFVRPERSVSAQLDLAQRAGADLRFQERVREWRADSSGIAVTTDQATYRGDQLVICPGAWAGELADLGVEFTVERQVQYWFEPADVDAFRVGRHPVYFWEPESGPMFYGFPVHEGSGGAAKAAFHHGGEFCTPDTIDREVHEAEIQSLRDCLRSRVPDLPHRLRHATTCMYTNTPDQHFVISRHPGHEQVIVACGFSGHGFKFAPVVGEILSELVADGKTTHEIAAFDPTRLN